MNVDGRHYRTIWMEGESVLMIDQNRLPFEFYVHRSQGYRDTCEAIRGMTVRGAGAIGAAGGYAMAQAFLEAPEKNASDFIHEAHHEILSTRPTARDLFYAADRIYGKSLPSLPDLRKARVAAVSEAESIAEDNIAAAKAIARNGNALLGKGMRILTHCNAGWLGFVDYGSALAPIYQAHSEKKEVFVWVSETRPRSQGARLTAWELKQENIPFKIIADTACAWLMAEGKVDMVITGADRIALNGDTANKTGTLDKAILADRFNIPFYVAAPRSTFDQDCPDGNTIIIEERDENEVHYQSGPDEGGIIRKIRVTAPDSTAVNPAFDVTPAGLIKAFITEKGILRPEELIHSLY